MRKRTSKYGTTVEVTTTRTIDKTIRSMMISSANAAFQRLNVRSARIEIIVVSDRAIAKFNQRYLGHKGPTDVLTFDLSDLEHPVHESRIHRSIPPVEGEIVVSYETARREANLRGHSLGAELALYVVHGILHLLGYDDHDKTSSAVMHEMEDEILGSIGLGPVYSRPRIAKRRDKARQG